MLNLLHEVSTWLVAIIGCLGLLWGALVLLEQVINWFYRWWDLRHVMRDFYAFCRERRRREAARVDISAMEGTGHDPRRGID